MAKSKRKSTEELATELDEFHHYESAKRMRFLQKELDNHILAMAELKNAKWHQEMNP